MPQSAPGAPASPRAPAQARLEGEANAVAQPGDSFAKIAEKEKSTTAHLLALNPGVDPAKLRPKQTVKVQNAHTEWYISGWRSWEDAIVAYNGGGNPNYLEEVKAQYALIKGARTPQDPKPPK